MRLYRPYSSCSGPSSGSITGSSGAKWSGSIKAEPQLGHLSWSSSGSTTFMPAWCSENTLRHTEQTNFVSVIDLTPLLKLCLYQPATSVSFCIPLGLDGPGLQGAVPDIPRHKRSSTPVAYNPRFVDSMPRDACFLSSPAFGEHPLRRHTREYRMRSRRRCVRRTARRTPPD